MRRIEPQQYLASEHRVVTHGVAPTAGNETWDHTMPAGLDVLGASEPFRETLHGLEIREVREPDVFRHFFGTRPATSAAT